MQIKDMDLYFCVCKPMSEWEREGLKGRPPTIGNLLSLHYTTTSKVYNSIL